MKEGYFTKEKLEKIKQKAKEAREKEYRPIIKDLLLKGLSKTEILQYFNKRIDDSLEYWALPDREEGKALTIARNYIIDLNLLRIPCFTFRKTKATKNFIEYKTERLLHGKRQRMTTRVGTAQGTLTAFDYMLFRGLCSFIRVVEENNRKRYFSAFTMQELLNKCGYKMENHYKEAYETLQKLPTLHIAFNHYHTEADKEPERLIINYFEKAYTPSPDTPERDYIYLFNETTGKAISNKLYRGFTFENIDKLPPLAMRLYELIETEIYKKDNINISFETLAGRIPLQDKNIYRRNKRILQALSKLKPLFEYREVKGYLTIRKRDNLFKTTETEPKPESLKIVKWVEPEDIL